MAGKPGMKGGGGKRPGAGRKPKAKPAETPAQVPAAPPVAPESEQPTDMLDMLQKVALGKIPATSLQVRAAIAAVQYTHTKRHDGGKKDEAADAAKKAASKFKTAAPPLKLVGKR